MVRGGACPRPRGANLASCWNIPPGGREMSTHTGRREEEAGGVVGGEGTQTGGLLGTSGLGDAGAELQLWGGLV